VIRRNSFAEQESEIRPEHGGGAKQDSAVDGRTPEAMHDLTAKRTLVKSPPELWSELSELERLAGHLGAFGEITITKLEPEHTVAWEGERASGTVSIEPSGWGTKVTLNARIEQEEAPDEPAEELELPRRRSFLARWWRRDLLAEPEPLPEAPPLPEDHAIAPADAQAVLDEALEALGSAHHRPFSRG
jgi:hypothetical protein